MDAQPSSPKDQSAPESKQVYEVPSSHSDNRPESPSLPDESSTPQGTRGNLSFTVIATDVVSILLPLAFIAFVIALFTLDRHSVDEREYQRWLNGIIVFASAFPIFFAVIVGRLMYQIARWRLEKGTSIGFLEQMIGSRTFGGAIITQFHLGAVNFVGVGLVIVWIFSPLGTQAILRSLETRLEPVLSDANVVFMETTLNSGLTGQRPESDSARPMHAAFFGYLGSSLSALLNMPEYIQTDDMDLWGNVKIPFLGESGYNNKTTSTRAADWEEVHWAPEPDRYSALAGIPISNIPVGNSTFPVESGYIELNCYDFVFPEDPMESVEEFILIDDDGRDWVPRNGSYNGVYSGRAWSIALDRFVDPIWTNTDWHEDRRGLERYQWHHDAILNNAWESPGVLANETGIVAGPTRLVFYSSNDDGIMVPGTVVWGYCDVRQRYVESLIHCELTSGGRPECSVRKQRPSRRPHAPETISHLSFPEIFEHITKNLPKATSIGGVASTDLGLRYLKNPKDMSRNEGSTDMYSDYNSDKLAFSRRLSQLLNTYIMLSSFDFSKVTAEGDSLSVKTTSTAEAEVSRLVTIYVVPRVWIALGLLSCLVFLLGGIASVVVTHMAASPEILGYASTLVRDSKFMDLPPDAGQMSATDILKILKHRRVRYGYSELTQQGRPLVGVGPEEEIARL